MHRPTIIFLLSHKITTVQQKTKTKLHQTTTTNNPHILSIKNTPKTKHNNPSHHTPIFLNIKIIAGWFAADKYFHEPTSKHSLLIKPQCNRKRQNKILHFEITILQTRKSKTLYF